MRAFLVLALLCACDRARSTDVAAQPVVAPTPTPTPAASTPARAHVSPPAPVPAPPRSTPEVATPKPEAVVVAAPDEPAPAPSGETAVLPAGVHWLPWTYSPCDHAEAPAHCDDPRAAVIARIDATADAATTALATIDRSALAPGYPLVAHTDELVLATPPATPGVAIVLGLFASRPAADAWQRAHAPDARIEALAHELASAPQPEHVVVRARQSHRTSGCTIVDGAIAIIPYARMLDAPYEDVTFPCAEGGDAALPWQSTLYHAVIGEDRRGSLALWQTVGAECDAPRFMRWAVDETGRTRGRARLLKVEPCG